MRELVVTDPGLAAPDEERKAHIQAALAVLAEKLGVTSVLVFCQTEKNTISAYAHGDYAEIVEITVNTARKAPSIAADMLKDCLWDDGRKPTSELS